MSLPPLRVVVVDDEPLARQRLRALLEPEKDFVLVGEAGNGLEAVSLVRKIRPEVLLLDIRLPGLDGFDVLARLQDQAPPSVIFITASGDHAVQAFESQAADYLLKPFTPARFRESLRRVRLRSQQNSSHVPARPSPARLASGLILLKGKDSDPVVAIGDIRFVRSVNTRSRVVLPETTLLIRESLGALARRLPSNRFVRISRSVIVNLDHVAGYEPKSHGDQHLLLRGGTHLTVSRSRRETVLRLIERACGGLLPP